MRIIKAIRNLIKLKREVNDMVDEVKIDVPTSGSFIDSFLKSQFYQKHKAKIWSIVWGVGFYLVGKFGGPILSDAVANIPGLNEVQTKVAVLEEQASKADRRLVELEKDVKEIKFVLTPPNER